MNKFAILAVLDMFLAIVQVHIYFMNTKRNQFNLGLACFLFFVCGMMVSRAVHG